MKKFRILCLILCFCQFFAMQIPVSATESEETGDNVTSGCYSLDAAVPYLGSEKLVENVEAALLYEKNSETLMYTWNPDVQVYPSSLVKILTAYLAVEMGDPSDLVTVTQEMLDYVPEGAVSADLQVGETLTLGDLIYCMMVGSANDAAVVIAVHISGSVDSFVEEMNTRAQDMGCTATVFKNPHGIHDPEQVSTVRDLAKIVTAASENETFREYFSAVSYTVPATNMSELRNLESGNFLMTTESMEVYYDERVTGGRTGTAEDATRCLATTAQVNGLDMVCIVTGAQSSLDDRGNTLVYGSFKETTALYDLAGEGNKAVRILYEGQTLRQSHVINGDSDVVLGSDSSVTAILPVDVTMEDLSFQYSDNGMMLEAPVKAGEKLSTVKVYYGGMCIAQAELVAMNEVRNVAESVQTLTPKAEDSGGATVVIIIVCILVLGVGAVFTLRHVNKVRYQKRRAEGKKRRNEHRRSR